MFLYIFHLAVSVVLIWSCCRSTSSRRFQWRATTGTNMLILQTVLAVHVKFQKSVFCHSIGHYCVSFLVLQFLVILIFSHFRRPSPSMEVSSPRGGTANHRRMCVGVVDGARGEEVNPRRRHPRCQRRCRARGGARPSRGESRSNLIYTR